MSTLPHPHSCHIVATIIHNHFESPNTIRDTEFRAPFFCHFKKLRCKLLFIVHVTFKSKILKFIFCSRQSHVNQNRRKSLLYIL
jgi:hypothetical protein